MRAFRSAQVRVRVVGSVNGRSRHVAARADADPLMVRAARGEAVERAPAWMMRQAGRYMASYRALADKHPGFRERSENADLVVEISLQPHAAFAPDGVILFSDILTPLEACGVPFGITDAVGPIIDNPITDEAGLKALHAIDLDRLDFVGSALKQIRSTVRPSGAATLGFVGAPWTIATYVIEGKPTSIYRVIKRMAYEAPALLDAVLSHLAEQIGEYVCYQIASGADYIQIFDSWGGHLAPSMWDRWSRPYIERIISTAKQRYPQTPIMVYANGAGGLIERLGATGADVVGLDWMTDMADARQRLGPAVAVQGNLDPVVLFGKQDAIKSAVDECLQKAGNRGHILNLGHGVPVGTPEESVKYVFDLAKQAKY